LAINGHHGWASGGVLALVIYSLADIARISVLLTTKTWSRYLVTVVAFCAATSVFCATETLLTSQGNALLEASTGTSRHNGATSDLARARETLARIKETADAPTHQDIASAAKGRAETAEASDTARMGQASCFKSCKAAKADHETILARLADAKARDTATAALAEAKGEEKNVKPVEVSGIAAFFAMNGLGSKDTNARYVSLGTSILVIVLLESLVYLIAVGTAMLSQPVQAVEAAQVEEVTAPNVAMDKKSNILRLQLWPITRQTGIHRSQNKLAESLSAALDLQRLAETVAGQRRDQGGGHQRTQN
jgi:hypothetical protein